MLHTHLRVRGAGLPKVLAACALLTITGSAATGLAAADEEAPRVSVAVNKADSAIAYGEPVTVRGSVEGEEAGRKVSVQYAPRGEAFRTMRTARTDAQGRFSARVRPAHTGTVRAIAGASGSGERRRVTVAGRISARGRMELRRGQATLVTGALRPAVRGRAVRVQVRTRGGWRTADTARTAAKGRFKASWKATRTGVFRVRVRFAGDTRNASASRKLKGAMSVYRSSAASWYGPGFYGNRTACGRTLGTNTLGVAHKSLPCGTRVKFRYGRRTVVAPVIDRGPFAGNREWDLTGPTKRALGFPSTGTVWSTR